MKLTPKLKILLVFSSLLILHGSLHGQYIDTVCAGDHGIKYAVQKSLDNSTLVWTVGGGDYEVISSQGDTIQIDWGEDEGDYELEVVEISDFGCYGEPVSGKIKIYDSPDIYLGADEEVCYTEELIFDLGRGFANYRWHDGSTYQTYVADSTGVVWGEVTNAYGCIDRDSVNVIVHSVEAVDILMNQDNELVKPEDLSICGDSTVILDAGQYTFYTWSTGDITRSINVGEGAQLIWVEVEDENGCISSDTVIVYHCQYDDFMGKITNAFTPNNDGNNDVWEIRNIQYFPKAKVVVYDRWGRLVYSCEEGYNNGSVAWDGRDMKGKKLPMAAYYYVIYLQHGNLQPLTGTVTLIR